MNSKKNGHLVGHIVTIAIIGFVIYAIITSAVSVIMINDAYHKTTLEELKVACEHLSSEFEGRYDGEWHMDGEDLYKGDTKISGNYKVIDELKGMTGVDYTIFFGKTRMITTINKAGTSDRVIGTDASDGVIAAVLNGGKDYSSTKVDIQGANYYVYYVPMKDSSGKVVGMYFAGRPSSAVDKAVFAKVAIMVVLSVVVLIVLVIVSIILSIKYSALMKQIADNVSTLAGGDLRGGVAMALKNRNDELGIIAVSVDELSGRLKEVIGNAQSVSNEVESKGADLAESSGQASQASEQVTDSVGEISKGAVAQAESVESAAADTDQIGRNIDTITDNVNQLNSYTADMKQACDEAMTSLEKLLKQSEEVTECVDEIGKTIVSTNESSKQISQFSQAIADIATQTNLLSLNASIEAARAGEAGRGFAVVADEIRALADQSSQSADEIKRIVDSLLAGSEESVEVMGRLNENFGMQAAQLESTKQGMNVMSENVRSVRETSEDIATRVDDLTTAKNALTEIITDLSAISEENAASAEETNASMEELNATFTVIGEAASILQSDAAQLKEAMAFFKI